MLQTHQIDSVINQPIYGADQAELGSVARVYLDDATGQPAWAAVRTGTQECQVPGLMETSNQREGMNDGGTEEVPRGVA